MSEINEIKVIDFYIDLIRTDKIVFLFGKENLKSEIKGELQNLRMCPNLNGKIGIAKILWKKLFEGAMTSIDPDKRGYDRLFRYFDEYVKFEELIFASDSFYRDHTLHSIWVYLLGEYLIKSKEFETVFNRTEIFLNNCSVIADLLEQIQDDKNAKKFRVVSDNKSLGDAMRCISALTHDLGYPLKKISKINQSIKNVLPFFSINQFNDFTFGYDGIQQNFINSFLDVLSHKYNIRLGNSSEIIKLFDSTRYALTRVKVEILNNMKPEEIQALRESLNPSTNLHVSHQDKLRYSFDFEEYQHGIMSAFLLIKTLDCFRNVVLGNMDNRQEFNEKMGYTPKENILKAISNHTSRGYQITGINDLSEFLIFVDEIEEFSRISRGGKQLRDFIPEFCTTRLSVSEGFFEIEFEFDKYKLPNIDAERFFKEKCLRFLSILNVKKLDDIFSIRIVCLDKNNGELCNKYTFDVKREYVNIIVNEEEQTIPTYLNSAELYTKEEYQNI